MLNNQTVTICLETQIINQFRMFFPMNPLQNIIYSNGRCQIYNINIRNRIMCDADNMTETRASTQIPVSFWLKFKSYLCPCFLPKSESIIIMKNDLTLSINQKTSETNNSHNYHLQNEIFSSDHSSNMRRNTKRKNSMQFQENEKREKLMDRKIQLIDREFRETVNIELGYNHRMCSIDQYDCPIFNYSQHLLIPVGSNHRHLLVIISRANISIKLALLKKSMAAKKNKNQKIQQKKYGQFQFNKHWDQRYILFQKFDEGIKIDEQSWTVNPPQQVSQYIASKCHGAKIILDAFAGVGGNTIKLANLNSCVKVIANQANHKKMNFLINNSKVYEVESHIEICQNDFLKIDKKNIDVVVLQPLLANFHMMMGSHKQITTADFQPKLDKTILKSFKLASNLILLLPPEMNIENLCICINRCAIEAKRMKDSCTIKIQKIYCQMKVKYLLVCIGNLVQSQVKLNDELQYIYSKLKKSGDIYFKHKKVLKKMREDYGMLFMYNLVMQSLAIRNQTAILPSSQKKEIYAIDILYQIIRQRRLIPLQRLMKIINEQEYEYERQSSHFQSLDYKDASGAVSPVMQQQKMDENTYHIQETELTQSEYSHYSYHQSFDKKSSNPSQKSPNRLRQRQGTGNQSIIINRMNTDDSRERKDDSPLTPGIKRAKTYHPEEL